MTGYSPDPPEVRTGSRWIGRFMMIWIPQMTSLLGSGVVQFALVWWLTKTTASASMVSVGILATLLPRSILNPFVGTFVDRWNRRLIMIGSNMAVVLCGIVLALLFTFGTIRPRHIPAILLIHSLADTFYARAVIASTSSLAPADRLSRLAGIHQGFLGVVYMAAPAIGAMLLEGSSFRTVIAVDAAAALFAALPLAFVRFPRAGDGDQGSRTGFGGVLRDIGGGWRCLRNWRGAVGMLAISAMMNFIMQPYFSLLSVFVDGLGGGEREFGLLGAAVGAGFLLGGLILGAWRGFGRKMVTSLLGISVAGISLIATSFAPGFARAFCCVCVAGIAMPFCMGPIQALVQSTVRPDLQGRVFSIMEAVSTSVSPIGLLAAGAVFDAFGPSLWYRWGGAGALLLAAIGFLERRIRNLGVSSREETPPETVRGSLGRETT